MPFRKINSDENEIKNIINSNVASSMRTQPEFSELLKLNGCPPLKLGTMGSKIRKQLLKEAKNGDLTVDTVMPRAYSLMGEYLGIDEVRTFDENAVENTDNRFRENKMSSQLKTEIKLEKKFGVPFQNRAWFSCTIEEMKYSTFTNENRRDVDTAYVIVEDTYLDIFKESVFLKSNMGHRRIYYENIASIDYDARGRFHLSNSLIFNLKSSEHIQLKNIHENDVQYVTSMFDQYLAGPSTVEVETVSNGGSSVDDLMKYAELYEKGLITREEFDLKKNQLMGSGNNEPVEEFVPKFCTACGNPLEVGSVFCSNCGKRI